MYVTRPVGLSRPASVLAPGTVMTRALLPSPADPTIQTPSVTGPCGCFRLPCGRRLPVRAATLPSPESDKSANVDGGLIVQVGTWRTEPVVIGWKTSEFTPAYGGLKQPSVAVARMRPSLLEAIRMGKFSAKVPAPGTFARPTGR